MRMLIWTPMNAAELQKGMHAGNVGPAALVPVQSGTVLLLSSAFKLGEAAYVASRVRKLAGGGMLLVWNDEATLVYTFASVVGRGWSWGAKRAVQALGAQAKQSGPLGKLFDASMSPFLAKRADPKWQDTTAGRVLELVPGADRAAVVAALADFENGGAGVGAFLHAAGLPGVAQVAHLAGEGRADSWLHPLEPVRMPKWLFAVYLPVILLAGLATVLLGLSTAVIWVVGAVFAAAVAATAVVVRRRAVGGKPVNAVLPVIPVTQGAVPTD